MDDDEGTKPFGAHAEQSLDFRAYQAQQTIPFARVSFPLFCVGMVLYTLGWLNPIFQWLGLGLGVRFAPDAGFNIGILTLPAFLNLPLTILAGVGFFYCGVKVRHVLKKYLSYVGSVK